jgi:hypothetical protein
MAVITVNVGPKRVALTAYCPDDALGLAACDFVLAKVAELFAEPVSEEALRAYLIEKDPEYADLFRLLDEGWRLPKNPPFPVNPSNVEAELRIVRHLMREQMEQCGP